MKYFQNVVDTVRDLMSPNAEEQHYKNGMRKDPDGFMDIEWCGTKVLHSWNDLREQFQIANSRKAIAPTQFNPMSTRGHCIMVLEVEMPNPDNAEVKQRGRVYVCDLAGTEPAGDIVYAQYQKINFDDGTFEYKFQGAHPDMKKTKELQEQGKKINLSLSEMSQFFMKMAEAVMKKKLVPGASIPGCNSFFLCKYLKDTMLQARTYLFCAIRPEVSFLKYTFATLGFAKNASVVRLAPKKATVAASAAERKLMAELDAMKDLVAKLQSQQQTIQQQSNSGGGDAEKIIAELQAKLMEKQNDLQNLNEGNENSTKELEVQQQRQEYLRRGINLVAYDLESNTYPYFNNLDADNFRSNRFMYIMKPGITSFGPRGTIQLMSLAVVKDHCSVTYSEEKDQVILKAGKGETFRNGIRLDTDEEITLQIYDRIAMGDQLMMFRWPGKEESIETPMMNAENAVEEFQEALIKARTGGNNGNNNNNGNVSNELALLEEERKKVMEERSQWEQRKQQIVTERNEEEYQRAMQMVDNNILDLLPKIKEAKQIVDLMNRVTMSFDVVLEKAKAPSQQPGTESAESAAAAAAAASTLEFQIPKVKVCVENIAPKLSIVIEPQDFLSKLSLMKDELMKLKAAIDGGRDYDIPERHDPLYLMFDNDFHLGTATHWPEYLVYNLETEKDESLQEVKNVAVPYNTLGLLEVYWRPLGSPDGDSENAQQSVLEINAEEELLGKSWTYELNIVKATDLPVFCDLAYVSYEFFGEAFTTEAVQQTTFSPIFDYKKIHHVPSVTQEFLTYLKTAAIELQIHVTQHVDPPNTETDKIATTNAIVLESIKTNEPKGYEFNKHVKKPKTEVEIKCEGLEVKNKQLEEENASLKKYIMQLEEHMKRFDGNLVETLKSQFVNSKETASAASHNTVSSKLESAILLDSLVNG
jgi:hypothetical protein